MIDLTYARRIAEGRTKGPWHWYQQFDGKVRVEDDEEGPIAYLCQDADEQRRNAFFIAYFGTHADSLLDELEKLRRVAEAGDKLIAEWDSPHHLLAPTTVANFRKALSSRDGGGG